MKKYIAIFGSANSGVKTKDDAVKWAAQQFQVALGMGKSITKSRLFICEVVEEVRIPVPEIEIIRFEPSSLEPVPPSMSEKLNALVA